ncbi:STN and carboxypeptidase regulatory-like domain-containing protein [Chitinophaga sp. MM2321]|uniref:STN and carboxypeptidase regulatory-like domain-containing protein n=1 Tax=Chitinophaga sp. MM2321 TaxID=3137178 RepID=UPI0032D5A3B1
MPFIRLLLTLFLTGTLALNVAAQSLLSRVVSVEVKQRPLSEVLNTISKQGNFYFSYISNILPQDSLVSISARNKTVRQVLDLLLEGNYNYKESGNYIILLKKSSGQTFYLITGVVTDKKTGQRVSNASVYERQQLISTLTNNDGYFRLRLKDRYPTAAISVSKELYADTSLLLNTGVDQEVAVTISPTTFQLKTVEITGRHQVEKTWLGRMVLSSRQKVQSLNLSAFLADKPYQASLTPGLGTHGKMGAQVINKFSFNIIGGYTAGVDGLEVGTAFNIVKNDMQYVQIAGFMNIVGGKARGVQVAGFHNNVLDSMKGVQVAGFSNIVQGSQDGLQITGGIGQIRGNMSGVQIQGLAGISRGYTEGLQIAGGYAYSGKDINGVQVSGLYNYANATAHGVQLSAGGNITRGTMNGIQIASLFNYARRLNGVQIGLVNISDTSTGYSIGLVNIVRKGYQKVAVFSTDLLPLNLAWKTGRKELYSILLLGMSPGNNNKAYSFGYGVGKEIPFNKQLFLSAEVTGQSLYLGSWEDNSQVFRLQPSLHFKLADKISIFAGPSLSVHLFDDLQQVPGYKTEIPGGKYPSFNMGSHAAGWLGWQVGISIF